MLGNKQIFISVHYFEEWKEMLTEVLESGGGGWRMAEVLESGGGGWRMAEVLESG